MSLRFANSRPTVCPHCGAALSRNAKACPECGSDEHTGWSEAADSGYNPDALPDEDEYQEFYEQEFGKDGRGSQKTWNGKTVVFAAIALVLATLFVLGGLR